MYSRPSFRLRLLRRRVNTGHGVRSGSATLCTELAEFLFVLLSLWSILLNSSAFPQQPSTSSKRTTPQNPASDRKKAGTSATSADPGSRISFQDLIQKSGI